MICSNYFFVLQTESSPSKSVCTGVVFVLQILCVNKGSSDTCFTAAAAAAYIHSTTAVAESTFISKKKGKECMPARTARASTAEKTVT